jgi:hypothetical protein
MAVVTLDDGLISDSFQIGQEPWILKDAIVMLADQYNALTPEELAAMKQKRYDNWYAIVTNPSQE